MVKSDCLKNLLLFISLGGVVSCTQLNSLPSIDESGSETASESVPAEPGGARRLSLSQAMVLRYERGGVLEFKVELPAGAQIEIPISHEIKHLDYRNSTGSLERSSTGFLYPIRVLSVAAPFASEFPDSRLQEINRTPGGLYIFASIVGSLEGTMGQFLAITGGVPSEGFLKFYETSGRPKFQYTNALIKRFSTGLNRGVDSGGLSLSERTKWNAIFSELVRAVDRTQATSKSYLMMDPALAKQRSYEFEQTGAISLLGAWTIATQGTAVRHGFANVPCAEFQSELLRQAYQRAGYSVLVDFNRGRGNELIWSNTAAVANFSMALFRAGWIAWDSTKYRPPIGAFLMNGSGLTPGHTYISAGHSGMLIVDNGAPQGRDLRKTTEKTISIMYQTGVFFLPPGINPSLW